MCCQEKAAPSDCQDGSSETLDMQEERRAKLVFVGDSGVGKTALKRRFNDEGFEETFPFTIGIDCKIKRVDIDGETLKLQIWDTTGKESFREMLTPAYLRGAHGVMLVYDVTDERSFASVRAWFEKIQKQKQDNQHLDIMLIGNKTDLENKTVISLARGQALADELGMSFVQTSAKQNFNVEAALLGLTRLVKTRLDSSRTAIVEPKPGPVNGQRGWLAWAASWLEW